MTLAQGEAKRWVATQVLVSRDVLKFSWEQILSVAHEYVAKNLVNSVVAPIFWFNNFLKDILIVTLSLIIFINKLNTTFELTNPIPINKRDTISEVCETIENRRFV